MIKNLISVENALKMSLFAFLLVVPLAILFMWGNAYTIGREVDAAKFGNFGDFFGGVIGSIWAFCGVILFYMALKEQRADFKTNKDALQRQIEALQMQSEEFRLQRDELIQTRQVFLEQSKTLKQQRLESTYFALLDLYRKIVDDLNRQSQPDNYFKRFRQRLIDDFDWNSDPTACCADAQNHYVKLFYEHKEELSHYFKILYRILKILDDFDIEEKEKFRYVKILRSQISENEMLAIYYNSHSAYGGKFYSYVLTYNFLKHLPSISKPEFKGFVRNKNLLPGLLRFNNDIYHLLSIFIWQRDMGLKREDFMGERVSVPLPQNDKLILGFSSAEYHELDIEVTHPTNIEDLRILDFGLSEFIDYFKFFIFDIFINSTYQEITYDCITHKINGNKVIFQIRSKNKLLINVDRD